MSLRAQWERVATEARKNPEVKAPLPRKWTSFLDRKLRLIDDYLDGDWDTLLHAVQCARTGGAERRLCLSIARLTANECLRLDELVSGVWEDPKISKQIEQRQQQEEQKTYKDQIRQEAQDFWRSVNG